MVISTIAILIIFNFGAKKNSIIPTKLQLLGELSYSFISNDKRYSWIKSKTLFFIYIFTIYVCFILQHVRYDTIYIYCN